jgi:hypothetical protein
LDQAEVVLQEARRVLRGQKVVGFALFAETQLGRLALERGDTPGAVSALTGVIDEAINIDQDFFAIDASVHLADALSRSGAPTDSLEVVDRALEIAGDEAALYEVPLERLRAGALLATGRSEEALVRIENALMSAREQRLVYEEALLLVLKAKAGYGGPEVREEAGHHLKHRGISSGYDHRVAAPTV